MIRINDVSGRKLILNLDQVVSITFEDILGRYFLFMSDGTTIAIPESGFPINTNNINEELAGQLLSLIAKK